MNALPPLPGTYLLHLYMAQPRLLRVGKLGEFHFPAADYFYAGSATGPGGLRARVGRHLRVGTPNHWHLDYMLSSVKLVDCLFTTQGSRFPIRDGPFQGKIECIWSQVLATLPGSRVLAQGFGASDCTSGCAAHLVAFVERISSKSIQAILIQQTGNNLIELVDWIG